MKTVTSIRYDLKCFVNRLLCLMVDGKVSGLGVLVAPWCEVIFSLAETPVNLDLNATRRLRREKATS